MNESGNLRLENIANRVKRLLGSQGAEAAMEGAAALENADGAQSGLGEQDVQRIAKRLQAARTQSGGKISAQEADGIARNVVHQAKAGIEKLDGASAGALDFQETAAIEAVVQVRGRPAVRVHGDELEDVNNYPDASLWAMLVDNHLENIIRATSATAAVYVKDTLLPQRTWVQGTAFLIDKKHVMTNRHVLFPPAGGTRLARRIPGTTKAKLKTAYEVILDFAFDSGMPRRNHYRIVDIPFVAEDADPIDAAVLEVEKVSGDVPTPLAISNEDAFEIDRLYIVGHPGKLLHVPDDVQAVFNNPDERKRVSFGMLMDPDGVKQNHIVHDASTIGGFSGAPVQGFANSDVHALHYWGDPANGNRAIASRALRKHPTLKKLL